MYTGSAPIAYCTVYFVTRVALEAVSGLSDLMRTVLAAG